VIRSHRVAQKREHARATDIPTGLGLALHPFEVGSLEDVGRGRLPGEPLPLRNRETAPRFVSIEHVRVPLSVHLGLDRVRDRLLDLLDGGPEVPEIDRLPLGILAERLLSQIQVHPTGEGVGHHERGGSEVVRANVRIDASLEVPVSRENGADDQVLLLDRARDRVGEWAAVPDAGRAAVADQVEAELLERLQKPGASQVVGHDARARREARLHPGRDL
jgi:hypothetical protein